MPHEYPYPVLIQSSQHCLISQVLDLFFVHAKVVGDFVQHSETNLLAQFWNETS